MQTQSPIHFRSVKILGERLKLVPISVQYAEVIFEEFTDQITRFMIPATPKHINDIHEFIHISERNMEQNIDLTFAILDKSTEEFLGVCGLHGKPSPKEPILGIWLKKSAHGNRFGQEAIKFLTEWARQNLVYDYLIYPCDKDNIPSRKIAERLNGKIFRRGKVKSLSGKTLNEVAYKIL